MAWWQWGEKKVQRPDWKVVLYTRVGCHLCEDAWKLLADYQEKHHFSLESTDIDNHPELREKFDTCVPVVEINGKIRFRGQINPVLFDRLIAAKG